MDPQNDFNPGAGPGDPTGENAGTTISAYAAWPTVAHVNLFLTAAGLSLRLSSGDAETRILFAADEVIGELERTTLRQFIADTSPTVRFYDGNGTSELDIDEFITLQSVAIVGYQSDPGFVLANITSVQEFGKPVTRILATHGAYPAWQTQGLPVAQIFPEGRQNVLVTARFGFGPYVPTDLWNAVCGEIAARVGAEAVYDPAGRVSEWQEGVEREQHELPLVDATGWHEAYRKALRRYRRPTNRKLRRCTIRMI